MVVTISVNMDVSPVQAKSGSSDFSIKRILSEDRRREESEGPSWLCCTRYQPPRIPRAPGGAGGGGGACRARRSGRHARVPFTAAQAAALEAAYARAPYLAPPALRALAAALQLRDDRIKIWFQNRRARERREKTVKISPPYAVPLPPTTIPQGTLITSTGIWISRPKTEITAIGNQTLMMEPQVSNPSTLVSQRSYSESSDEDRCLQDRPESPLDVETVED